MNLNPYKSSGPEYIPARIVKKFAYGFANPLTDIFNKSLSTGVFPAVLKDSYITPVKKIPNPESENDIRPISLTSILSKILEDFVVCWMIEDVTNDIDAQQYGSLRGSSTTYCMLDMIRNWLTNLENP